jgi:hypothetical protein
MRIFDAFEHQIACHGVLTLWTLSLTLFQKSGYLKMELRYCVIAIEFK